MKTGQEIKEIWESRAFKQWESANDFHKSSGGVNPSPFIMGYLSAIKDFKEAFGDKVKKEIEAHKVSDDDFIKAHVNGLSRATYLINQIEPI